MGAGGGVTGVGVVVVADRLALVPPERDVDVGALGRWATNEWVIMVQLWLLLVAVMFSLVNEWMAGR